MSWTTISLAWMIPGLIKKKQMIKDNKKEKVIYKGLGDNEKKV